MASIFDLYRASAASVACSSATLTTERIDSNFSVSKFRLETSSSCSPVKIVFEIVNYYGGMRHCNDTEYYWGDIKRATYRVPIYGTLNKLFVTARYIIPQERICNFDDFWLWEPTLWRVTINKRDQTVSAYKETPFIDEQDIKVDDLKELVEAYIHK